MRVRKRPFAFRLVFLLAEPPVLPQQREADPLESATQGGLTPACTSVPKSPKGM